MNEQCKVCGQQLTLGDREDVAKRDDGTWVHKRMVDCVEHVRSLVHPSAPLHYATMESLRRAVAASETTHEEIRKSIDIVGDRSWEAHRRSMDARVRAHATAWFSAFALFLAVVALTLAVR